MTGTILIADDHPLFRQALAMAASAVCPAARIVESANLMTALNEAAAADDLILILLDLKMPGAEGYSGVALLHAEKSDNNVSLDWLEKSLGHWLFVRQFRRR